MQIRGRYSEGYALTPGKVPFHLPDTILPRVSLGPRFKARSVEDFRQSNIVLSVDPDVGSCLRLYRGTRTV